jgi:Fe-S-cluster containining protein
MNKFSGQKCGVCCNSRDDASFGMVVLDFEAKTLRKKSKELNIDFKLEPSVSFSDKKSQKELVVSYKFEYETCPFYQNKCLIYEDRPLLCRAFPLITAGIHSDGEIIRSAFCPENQRLKDLEYKSIKDTLNVYGNCFLNCYLFESLLKEIKDNMDVLIKNKIIILEETKGKYEKKDIGAFLREKGLFKEEKELLEEKNTLGDTKKLLSDTL